MTDEDVEIAEYALGTLPIDRHAAIEARLANDGPARAKLDQWRLRLAPIANALPHALPPPGLWSRIADATVQSQESAPRTIRRGAGAWVEIAPGVVQQHLAVDPQLGFRTSLIRMAPGSSLPAHPHGADEECLMLEGEISIGDLTLQTGDWHLAPRGHLHGEIRSRSGGLLYVRSGLDEHQR